MVRLAATTKSSGAKRRGQRHPPASANGATVDVDSLHRLHDLCVPYGFMLNESGPPST